MKLGAAAWFGEGDGTVKKKRRNFEEKKVQDLLLG